MKRLKTFPLLICLSKFVMFFFKFNISFKVYEFNAASVFLKGKQPLQPQERSRELRANVMSLQNKSNHVEKHGIKPSFWLEFMKK